MPSIYQYQKIGYQDIGETVLYGGWVIQPVSDTEFQTRAGGYVLVFQGTGLTYDGTTLTGGTIDTFRLYEGSVDFANLLADITSNFTLFTAAELARAFDLYAHGDYFGAVDLITASWTAEYFSHRNYPGGPLFGYDGGDGLFGNVLDDYVFGRGGDDIIILYDGYDVGHGDAGHDHVYGGNGNDVLFGGTGNDSLFGDNDNDKLFGETGTDTLHGGKGNDWLEGGSGDDRLYADAGNDTVKGGAGNDTILGDKGEDRLLGGAGDDDIEGNAGKDELGGGSGDDILEGGSDDDILRAGAGNDRMSGGTGNDRLITGAGSDSMRGGGDADTFVIRAFTASTQRIDDFETGRDRLDLRAFGFADADAALADATETGAGHLRFDLGDGQQLTVLNMTAAAITDDILT